MMNRVVVTGMGIVCSLGNNKQQVLQALKNTASGIEFLQEYADYGLRTQICGTIKGVDFSSN